jgi:NAD(P)-dependent dehydrogenase (short-subunit alcohol dehydrogenase family)
LSASALTVLVVAHNDAQTLLPTIDRLVRALTITVEDFAIVVFDDGSSDATARAAETAAAKYPFVKVRRNARALGLGYCTIQGSIEGDSAFLVYVPADNTWPLRSFVELFGHLGKADVITSYANNLLAAMPLPKRILSRAYSVLLNLLFRKGIRYYNGLTIYPVDYLRRARIRTHGFGFQAEALLKAVAAGYSFLEIALPVDAGNLPKARAITPANAWNAGITILRLLADFYLFPDAPSRRRRSASHVAGGQGADEMGVSEGTDAAYRSHSVAPRSGLRIVITGASSGIGAALAKALAEDGHRVFICARRADRLAEVASATRGIEALVCDVSDERQVAEFASALSAKVEALDVLINCAGGFGEIGPMAVADSARWWRTIETNLKGTYLVTRHLLALLAKGTHARVINFAGGGAFSPYPNYSAYACSKTAIVRLTECLAAELAPQNINVNAIAPGMVATEMHNATLAAGEERAGRLQYRRTKAILEQVQPSMGNVVKCVRMMLSPVLDELTGKTISSNFDPWQTQVFLRTLPEIVRSDLYTLRRVNVVNLPEGDLRRTLSRPWGDDVPEPEQR